MTEDGPRIFDGRSDIKVLARRIVGGNEIEAARIFVVNAGSVHEAAGTGWFERLRQLPNFKFTQVRRKRHKLFVFQETDHLDLTTLIRLQNYGLVLGNVGAAGRNRVGQ